MAKKFDSKDKLLKENGVFNSKAKNVKDELFKKNDFFDSHDLVQVKYEMLRHVKKDGWSIKHSSNTFGFSRTAFYKIQNAFKSKGIAGFIPRQRGPKGPHKLTNKILDFIKKEQDKNKNIRFHELSTLIEKQFKVKIHPRSIERALEKKTRKGKKKR